MESRTTMRAMKRDNLSELLPDFKRSLIPPLHIDGFATFVAYRVQPHRRQKRAYTGVRPYVGVQYWAYTGVRPYII